MISKIGIYTIEPLELKKLCLQAAEVAGLNKAFGGKPLEEILDITKELKDDTGTLKTGDVKIGIRLLEGLSLAYLAEFYQRVADPDTEYTVGVNIADDYKQQTELHLSDGILLEINIPTRKSRRLPFQQVMAQNILGSNKGIDIEEETIKQLSNKVQRRSDYSDVSGLIVAILPDENSRGLQADKIIEKCDVESFKPTFMLGYSDNLYKCTVLHLTKNLNEETINQQAMLLEG
jgi:hypothetical protein